MPKKKISYQPIKILPSYLDSRYFAKILNGFQNYIINKKLFPNLVCEATMITFPNIEHNKKSFLQKQNNFKLSSELVTLVIRCSYIQIAIALVTV